MPFHIAVGEGRADLLAILVELGVDMNAKNEYGRPSA
jgi:ankyrin repeat protein